MRKVDAVKNYVEIAKAVEASTHNLAKAVPEVMKALGGLGMATVGKDGPALSHKQKEMIALAVAIACRCDGCIAHHVHACIQAGTSREEVAELVGVCILMGGGPSTVYGSQALTAYDQFVAARE